MIQKFIPYLRKYRVMAILSPVFIFIEVICGILLPYYMSIIVDVGLATGQPNVIWRSGAIMLGISLIGMLTGSASAYFAAHSGQGLSAELRAHAFSKIQEFSFKSLDQFPTSTLITRLTSDSLMIGRLTQMSLRVAVRAPTMFVSALYMAVMINARMALVFAGAIPIIILISGVVMKMAAPRFAALRNRIDELNLATQENLGAVREVKAFVREEQQTSRFREAVNKYMESALYAIKLVLKAGPMFMLVMNVVIVAILWIGSSLVLGGELEIGKLASFLTYVGQIMMSMMMIVMVFLQYVNARSGARRILELIEHDIDLTSPDDGLTEVVDNSVEFEHVDFSYPGMKDNILSDLSFKVGGGHTLGILGATGSAKTTLVQLIPRLYDTASGRVLVGGKDVREYDLDALRSKVAIVLQQNTLFTGTIRSNLYWGNAEATDDELWDALEIADAKDFVRAMPNGLDSMVEQGGRNFSGGQRQRLTIARALLAKPKILIFDDSLSAVDMETERRIQSRLNTSLPEITTFVIAQRINSVENLDQILVMDQGHIENIGSHEELMESSVIYREIYDSQKKGVLNQ